ncbi:HPr family phosphocarrier protein [Pseudoalteromonas sp. C2R02]|jgi:phosphocarrier protein NPr|uniref:HPr family phosphocarrier protein n=1 Tax=Pseudoalteromonas sp. C2R02 TaxID=2841565 RepID=UPI001C08D617|nr:HPr family phosphocarrier protein [Pseudoalteromonas sp. C2R02]MBU2968135.1 HPr family phosphocarrier protein [Pseudoalteromonas sp. C2R02]
MQYQDIFLIENRLGLHARAASVLAQLATSFDAKVILQQGDKEAQADSVLALMLLEGAKGKKVTVTCSGPDAKIALKTIGELIADKFHEQE